MKFMRKYIHVARVIKPALTKEACDYIAEEYAKLRAQDNISDTNVAKVRAVYVKRRRDYGTSIGLNLL